MKSSSPSVRFVLVDALRGIAALAVVLHHVCNSSALTETLTKVIPGAIKFLFDLGASGVEIFFVLSGFVITHSLRSSALDKKALGNFILRRQLRLDPPYWVAILLVLGQQSIERLVPSLVTPPLPGFATIIANFFYLQNILGLKQIIEIAWTLCIEIQFYLLFILLLSLGRRGARPRSELCFSHISVGLVLVSGIACLALTHFYISKPWFFSYWHYFAAGVLSYCAWQQVLAQRYILLYFALFFCSALLSPFKGQMNSVQWPAMFTGLMTAALLFFAGQRGGLPNWGNLNVLQYLGRISYSLYLVHLPVVLIVLKVGFKLTHENQMASLVWFLLAIAASIGVAHIFYNLIEKPSVKWASRLKEKRAEPAPPPHPVAELNPVTEV